MGVPRILAVASAMDLDFRYGCTPAWWQLWKGLYEAGVDLVITPYRGHAVLSPWWRVYENPMFLEAEAFAKGRSLLTSVKRSRAVGSRTPDQGPRRLLHETIWRWVTPRWRRHLERIVEREKI